MYFNVFGDVEPFRENFVPAALFSLEILCLRRYCIWKILGLRRYGIWIVVGLRNACRDCIIQGNLSTKWDSPVFALFRSVHIKWGKRL